MLLKAKRSISCFLLLKSEAFLLLTGQVSEWFKEPVLKTGDTATYRGFESHPVRHNLSFNTVCGFTQVVKGLPC